MSNKLKLQHIARQQLVAFDTLFTGFKRQIPRNVPALQTGAQFSVAWLKLSCKGGTPFLTFSVLIYLVNFFSSQKLF